MSSNGQQQKKDRNKENLRKAAADGASSEIVQRFGSAGKEHIVSYTGVDNETGKVLKRSLKDIAGSKVNPDYEFQNLQQQAGFSAEIKAAARENAENIIAGSKRRKIRTDDLGRVNDPLYDHVVIDGNGNIIDGSGSQMKFLGASQKDPTGAGAPGKTINKLMGEKFAKYLDNDVKIEVPSDYYDEMRVQIDERISELEKQAASVRQDNKADAARQKEQKISKLKKIRKNLKKSSVSSKDAMSARKQPALSAAKDMAGISHRAGLESARYSAAAGGAVSMVQNMAALYRGDVEPDEALMNVAKDTACTAAAGYAAGFAGSALKGAMQNSASTAVRGLAKTNLPAAVVSCGISAGKSLKRYFSGEIDGVQCFQELGEQGTGMVSSAMFGAIGQAAVPIPIVGAMIGSMIGYTIASASYGVLMGALSEAKLARERRIAIEKECEEHIRLIRAYRQELEANIRQYLGTRMVLFNNAFDGLKSSLDIGDVDGFIANANQISAALGKEVQFKDFDEFDSLMNSSEAFKF